jgi:hypothetical protein
MTAEDLKAVAQAYLRRATDAETRLAVVVQAIRVEIQIAEGAGFTGVATRLRTVLDGTGQQDTRRCQHVSASPWGPTQCALPDGHTEQHAYSPSESTGQQDTRPASMFRTPGFDTEDPDLTDTTTNDGGNNV